MYLALLVGLILASSCQSDKTLEHYFVEKQNENGFVILDLPSSLLEGQTEMLDEASQEALKSIRKLNVLFAKPDSEKIDFEKEQQKIREILKNSMYENLMQFNNQKNEGAIYIVDKNEKITEMVLYGYQEKQMLIIVRVLGNDIKLEHAQTIMNLASKQENTSGLQELLKPLFEK